MLAFANQILLDVLHEDGLVVAAKGLGIEDVFFSLLKVYSDPGNLVLVIGTNDEEDEYFISRLEREDVKATPKRVTSEYSANDRRQLYLHGGVLFITTRILVVDFLTDRIPANLITGILVYRAHRTIDSCQEAFILRLYRQKNTTGFVKAFSGSPIAFTTGFCQVGRVMRQLFVKNLHLWPRFHATVVDSLASCSPEVVELRVEMTQAMRTIQTSTLDLMNFTLQELKRLNPSLAVSNDNEEERLSVELAISKAFHKNLQRELDPIWHRLSWKTKQLVSDLKTLRSVLTHLANYDAVTFYNFVSALRTTENAMRSGGWMILDSAETLFVTAKSRVFGSEEIERCPKWEVMSQILEEIEEEIKSNGLSDSRPAVKALVFVADERVAQQLQDYLAVGAEVLLKRMAEKNLGDNLGQNSNVSKEPKNKGVGKKSTPQPQSVGPLASPVTVVKSMQSGSLSMKKLIEDLRPRYVILYDSDVGVVRQIEILQANLPDFKMKVFFIMYAASAEEQAYLSALRREKEAMEMLIREKASLVFSDEPVQDKEGEAGAGKVVVDMREFRCELPSLLHRRSIAVEPVTIEVGDYILTPDICVERKSISDLIGSLQCGRLYSQATSMTRFYARPMLLIEFEAGKPFALQGKYYLSRDAAGAADLVARLQLLTLHFPKLRLLWSPGPHATAELFDELKRGRPEPDAGQAAAISIDHADELASDRFNPAVQDFVSKLPGISTRNVHAVLNRVDSLVELLQLSIDELENVLGGRQAAEDLYNGLHGVPDRPLQKNDAKSRGDGSKAKRGRFKKISTK